MQNLGLAFSPVDLELPETRFARVCLLAFFKATFYFNFRICHYEA
jgi:hypothetical protein